MWLLVPIVVYSLLYLFVRHIYTYWERKGFPCEAAGFRWSFFKQVYQREIHHVEAVCETYKATAVEQVSQPPPPPPPSVYGVYFSFRPILLIRDLDMAQTILEHSYGHFNDGKWDYMRGYRKVNLLEKLAPIFSNARLEQMYPVAEKVGDYMVKHLRRTLLAPANGGEIEVDLVAVVRNYSINMFGNLIYGLNDDNFENPDAVFHHYLSKSLSNRSITSYTLNRLPKKSSLTYRLRDIIKENVEAREDGGCIRKDVLQLLVKYRNGNDLELKGSPKDWHVENVFESEKFFSIKKLSKIAEALLYMGLDTIESVIVLTLYEALRNPGILSKLVSELDELNEQQAEGKEENAKVSIKDVEGLKYMNVCIEETMRLYPPVPIIERKCCKNFIIPESRYTINEGKTIMIPLMAMQRDERYYPEPLIYKPERFLATEQQKGKIARVCYGFGASSCVAQNFSKLLIKMALMKILQNFKMSPIATEMPTDNGKTTTAMPLEIVHTPTPFIKSRDGFKVKLKQRPIKPTFYL